MITFATKSFNIEMAEMITILKDKKPNTVQEFLNLCVEKAENNDESCGYHAHRGYILDRSIDSENWLCLTEFFKNCSSVEQAQTKLVKRAISSKYAFNLSQFREALFRVSPDRDCGICYILEGHLNPDLHNSTGEIYLLDMAGQPISTVYKWMAKHYESWPSYSGDKHYPVPSPDPEITPNAFFSACPDYWAGQYGEWRLDLLNHLKQKFSEEFPNV